MSLRPDDPAVQQVARSFGVDAGRYDRVRPGYPEGLVAAVVAALPGRRVLDVGCGTGIAARQFEAAGCHLLGVDPDPRMAAVARAGGLSVEVGSFEAWDPSGRRFDGVIAGQAWHWVDAGAGARKAGQVLVPGGRLAVFWNAFDPPPAVADTIAVAFRRAVGDAGGPTRALPGLDVYGQMLRAASEGIVTAGCFTEPEQWRFDWERAYTRDEWLEQVPTFGGFNRLDTDTQRQLLAMMGSAVDSLGGRFTMRYAAVCVTAVSVTAER